MNKLRLFSCQTMILTTVIKIKLVNKSKSANVFFNSKYNDLTWMYLHTLTTMTLLEWMKDTYIS